MRTESATTVDAIRAQHRAENDDPRTWDERIDSPHAAVRYEASGAWQRAHHGRGILLAEVDRLREALRRHVAYYGGASHRRDECPVHPVVCEECSIGIEVDALLREQS